MFLKLENFRSRIDAPISNKEMIYILNLKRSMQAIGKN